MLAYENIALFIIPYFIDEYALKVEDILGDRAETGTNLLNN